MQPILGFRCFALLVSLASHYTLKIAKIFLETKSMSTHTSTNPPYTFYYISNPISSITLPAVPRAPQHPCWPSAHKMDILNIPPELILWVAENLSLEDLSSFRSTCNQVWRILTPCFRKLCLQDVGKFTALQWAAVHGYVGLIELAISNGAEINAPLRGKLDTATGTRGVPGRPCWFSSMPISSIADYHAETDAKDSIIRTPLFLAACYGRVEAIKVLLKLGASMQCFGGMSTPAHISAFRGDVDCMRAFIGANFDINVRGTHGETILHQTTFCGVEMVAYILQQEGGRNLVNARNSMGSTALHRLIQGGGRPPQRRLKVELLLQHGADIHAKDDRGNTPAHVAAHWGNVDCLRILIAAGCDLHARGPSGKTILHCAIDGGEENQELIEYLLGLEEGKRIIDVEDDGGSTPLRYALQFSMREVVEVLLIHGATRISL